MIRTKRVHLLAISAKQSAITLAILFSLSTFATLPRIMAQDKAGKELNESQNRRALAYYANAADYQNNGAFELAAQEWEKLLEQFPEHPQASTAWHHLGVCRLQQEKPDLEAATVAFTNALKDSKLNIREESLVNLGWAQFTQARQLPAGSRDQRKELEAAKKSMLDFLKTYPDSSYIDQALYYLGDAELMLGDRDKAIAYFKKLLDTSSLGKSNLRPDALYALAVAYDEEKKAAEADRQYKRFLEEYPTHRLSNEVRLRKAESLLRENKGPEANKLLGEVAASVDGQANDYTLLRLGHALSLSGDTTKAAEQYERILKEHADSSYAPAAHLVLGQFAYRKGNYDQAVEHFRKSFEAGGEQSADAAHWLATTLLRQNKPQEAITILERVRPTMGDSPMAADLHLDYADALYAVPDKLSAAYAEYAAVADKYPESQLAPRAIYNAGFAALQLGKIAEARKWSEQFLQKFPQDPLRNDVAYIAAESLLLQGEHEAAAQAYSKLISVDKNNPSVLAWTLRQATAYFLGSKYQEAIELLKKNLDKFGQEQKAEALYLIGASNLYLEQIDVAIENLRQSNSTSSKWGSADEVLMLLAEAYQRKKDEPAARMTLETLLKQFPNSRLKAQAEYKLAQLSAASGNYDEAISRYRAIAGASDGGSYSTFAAYGIVWSLMQQEKFEQALKELKPLLAQKHTDSIGTEIKLAEGICLRKLGKLDAAIAALRDFQEMKPSPATLANGLFELAMTYSEQNNSQKSQETLAKILSVAPNYPGLDKVLYELAWNAHESGTMKEAESYFKRITTDFPQSDLVAESFYMIGQNAYEAKEYDAARTAYQATIDHQAAPDLAEKALYKLGWSYFQEKQFDKAKDCFAQQTTQHPNGPLSIDGLFMQAECEFKKEDFKLATKSYAKVKEMIEKPSPTSKVSEQVACLVYLHGGQSLREQSKFAESDAWYEAIIQKYPTSEHVSAALYELGFSKQEQNKLDEALKYFTEAASDYRDEAAARARFMMGELYFSQRDFAKAIPEFQRVMYGYGGEQATAEVKNWQAKAAFEAARCSEVLIETLQGPARDKAVATAQEFYQFILAKHAAHELADRASNRLDSLQKLR